MFYEVRYAIEVFRAKFSPLVDAGGQEDSLARRLRLIEDFAPVAMAVSISAILFIVGIILIFSSSQNLEKVGIGFIGTVTGRWLLPGAPRKQT